MAQKENNMNKNPLYFFIKDQNLACFVSKSNYFLIDFKAQIHGESKKTSTSEEYNYKIENFLPLVKASKVDCHLRVDANCYNAYLGTTQSYQHAYLSPAHYTERYYDIHDNVLAVAHVYFDFQTKIIKYTLHNHARALIELTDVQISQLEAHAQQVLPVLSDARMRMDSYVKTIDISKVRELTSLVDRLIVGKNTEQLTEKLSELIQLLSRYDTYTFGEDVGRTIFYRNLLENIINGRQQVTPLDYSAQQQEQSRQVLNDPKTSLKDSAIGSAKANTHLDDAENSEGKTTLQRPKEKSALFVELQQHITQMNKVKQDRFKNFAEYVEHYNALLSAWCSHQPKTKQEEKLFTQINVVVNRYPSPNELFLQALTKKNWPVQHMADYFKHQIPALIADFFEKKFPEISKKNIRKIDQNFACSLEYLFEKFGSMPMMAKILERILGTLSDGNETQRLSIKGLLFVRGFKNSFDVFMRYYPQADNFLRNMELSLLDIMTAAKGIDNDTTFQMLESYIMNGGALSMSGTIRVNPECAVNGLYGHTQLTKAESEAFYSSSNARLFQVRGKNYDKNLLNLLCTEYFFHQREDEDILTLAQIDKLAQMYIAKVGATVVHLHLNSVRDQDSSFIKHLRMTEGAGECVLQVRDPRNRWRINAFKRARYCFYKFTSLVEVDQSDKLSCAPGC